MNYHSDSLNTAQPNQLMTLTWARPDLLGWEFPVVSSQTLPMMDQAWRLDKLAQPIEPSIH